MFSEATLKAMKRQRDLKAAEEKYRAAKGQHPAFPWSLWGDKPRSGALWSEEELDELTINLNRRFDGKSKLGIEVFAELAWIHGRSANAIYEKVAAHMGWKYFNQMFSL